MTADGSGGAVQITSDDKVRQCPTSWSSEGVLAFEQGSMGDRDIWVLKAGENQKPESFLSTKFNERGAQFSPNGKWIAFTSNRSGQDEVYVLPYPGPGELKQISTDGGKEPVWASGEDELFYRNRDQMMAVPIQMSPVFQAGTPQLLFKGSFSYGFWDWSFNYDISPDGQKFIMTKTGEDSVVLNIILNWSEELKRMVPRGK
jgi:Tol biopolymer transport system component